MAFPGTSLQDAQTAFSLKACWSYCGSPSMFFADLWNKGILQSQSFLFEAFEAFEPSSLSSLPLKPSKPPFVLTFEVFEAPFVLTFEAFEAPSSSRKLSRPPFVFPPKLGVGKRKGEERRDVF